MKKAFSLIELLIVVIIMGVVYSMAVGTIKGSSESEVEKVTLKNLKQYLQSIPREKNVRLLCLDSCLSCSIYVDGKMSEADENSFDGLLNNKVEVYRYEHYSGMQEQKADAFFNEEEVEEDVCFSYTINKKGIGEQVYVKFKNKIYDYTLNSGIATVYNSLEEVVDAKQKLRDEAVQ